MLGDYEFVCEHNLIASYVGFFGVAYYTYDCLDSGLWPLYGIPEIYNAGLVSDWRWRWGVLDGGQLSETKDHAIVFLIHLITHVV